MTRVMLDRWANALSDRKVIEEFWEWLQKRRTEECLTLSDIHVGKELNAYHEIDQAQLDRERRALLEHSSK